MTGNGEQEYQDQDVWLADKSGAVEKNLRGCHIDPESNDLWFWTCA